MTTTNSPPPYRSARYLAKQRGCTTGTVYDLIHAGFIQAVTVDDGRHYLIPAAECERVLADWPSRNHGATKFWQEFRRWRAEQRSAAAQHGEAA